MTCEVAVFGFTLKPIPYTYLVPNNLPVVPGSLVEVPFGKRKAKGVVTSVSKSDSSIFDLRAISSLLSDQPLLTPIQLSLAQWISESYFISLAESINIFLPRIPKHIPVEHQLKEQELILFPTARQVESAQHFYPGLIYSPSHTIGQFDQAWFAIRTGAAKTVLGTRSALFAPFNNLKKVTIFQTESDLYKEERRPYYRALSVARKLADLHSAKLKAISYSPRVQDQFLIPHEIKKITQAFTYQITDLKKTHIINNKLLETLRSADPKKTLIFLNRRSDAGPLTCNTCKETSYTSDPSVCPNCGSADVKFKVINLATLSKKILDQVGGEFTFSTQQIFFERRSSARFDLIVVLSADTYVTRNSFDAQEKTFQMITSLIQLLGPKSKIIIQSAFPNHFAIQTALQNDFPAFYTRELESRREAGYPPFSQLARLTFTESKNEPEKPRIPSDIELFGPFDGKSPYFIARGQNLKALESFARPWKLDIDPLSI